jgi:hypothetical protein
MGSMELRFRRLQALTASHPIESQTHRLASLIVTRSVPMVQPTYPAKPVFTKIPANWKTMTDADKKVASEAIAKAIQRQLGIKPKD